MVQGRSHIATRGVGWRRNPMGSRAASVKLQLGYPIRSYGYYLARGRRRAAKQTERTQGYKCRMETFSVLRIKAQKKEADQRVEKEEHVLFER